MEKVSTFPKLLIIGENSLVGSTLSNYAKNDFELYYTFYNTKINKLGHTDKTSDEAIYAPLVLTILSAVLCYGLADKIYI